MEQDVNNNYEEIVTYVQLDKELRRIRKKKRKNKNLISSFFKRQISILRHGTLYMTDHQFVAESISLINAFYIKKSISIEDMLIRKNEINFYKEFKNSIKMPIFLIMLTGIFFVVSNIFSSTKEMFDFLISNISKVINALTANLDKLIGDNSGLVIFALLQFILIVILC